MTQMFITCLCPSGSRRSLERFDERITQELAARKYKRAETAAVIPTESKGATLAGGLLESLIGAITATGLITGISVLAPSP
jgi:hypothetical protein